MKFIESILKHHLKYKSGVVLDKEQSPKAVILTCSDSRVQLSSISDSLENNFFVVRNIGNQFITSKGSVDYGVRILKSPYLIIMGHSSCGAIKSSVGNLELSGDIGKELDSLKAVCCDNKSDVLDDCAIKSVNFQVEMALKEYYDLVESDKLTIFGLFYNIHEKSGLKVLSVNGRFTS